MSSNPVFPDRQLTFSPELAATIGLEEAILLQGIGNRVSAHDSRWHSLVISALERDFPFWDRQKLMAPLQRLADLGVLTLVPGQDGNSVRIAGSYSEDTNLSVTRETIKSEPEAWQPTPEVIELLQMNHGIDAAFSIAQLASFDGTGHDTDRDTRFRQHVLAAWRRRQSEHNAFKIDKPKSFDRHWQPSADAMDIMLRDGISTQFIELARPEFILYWTERGGPPNEVNSRFIGWIRQRWSRHTGGIEHSTEPTRLAQNWQPDPAVWEMLAMAGIDRNFGEGLLNEFILYWVDSNEMQTSWNSKFLQWVKSQWRRQQRGPHNGADQTGGGSGGGRTKDSSIADDLSDTSWV